MHPTHAAPAAAAAPPAPADPAGVAPSRRRRVYLHTLTWAFTAFNSVRVFAYLPNLVAIHAHGDSSQHSLLTWVILTGANTTMAGWLYEHNGQRMNKAIAVNIGNAGMCAAMVAAIAWYRF